jgi:hypothetical protein
MFLSRMIMFEIAVVRSRQAMELTGERKREMCGHLSSSIGMPVATELIRRKDAIGIVLECVSLISKYVMVEREGFTVAAEYKRHDLRLIFRMMKRVDVCKDLWNSNLIAIKRFAMSDFEFLTPMR